MKIPPRAASHELTQHVAEPPSLPRLNGRAAATAPSSPSIAVEAEARAHGRALASAARHGSLGLLLDTADRLRAAPAARLQGLTALVDGLIPPFELATLLDALRLGARLVAHHGLPHPAPLDVAVGAACQRAMDAAALAGDAERVGECAQLAARVLAQGLAAGSFTEADVVVHQNAVAAARRTACLTSRAFKAGWKAAMAQALPAPAGVAAPAVALPTPASDSAAQEAAGPSGSAAAPEMNVRLEADARLAARLLQAGGGVQASPGPSGPAADSVGAADGMAQNIAAALEHFLSSLRSPPAPDLAAAFARRRFPARPNLQAALVACIDAYTRDTWPVELSTGG